MKKGQIALFVIIAILLVSAVGLIVYTQREALGITLSPGQAEIRPITSEIDNCLKSTAENGVYLLGMQGGYIEPTANSFETNFSISYAYSNGKILFPSKANIEKQLSGYINLMLPRCVDFSKWPDFSVTTENTNSTVIIRDNEILIAANWPLTLKKGATFRLEKFSLKLPVRLGIIYSSASQIVNSTFADPSRIDLGSLIDIHGNYGLITDISPYNQTIIYSLTDPKSIILDRPYTFLLAVKL